MDIKSLLGDAYKDEMTAAELAEALEGITIPDAAEVAKLKKAVSESNAEAAKYRRELKARMSEEEAAKVQQEEEKRQLAARVKELEERETITSYTNKYLAQGYDEVLAKETASALAKGEMDKVFENQAKFIALKEKSIRTAVLAETPPPSGSEAQDGANYQSLAAEAFNKGEIAQGAYYTRLASQEKGD